MVLATLSRRYSAKPLATSASTRCSSETIQRSACAELQVAVRRARHGAFCLGVLVQAAVLAFAVHQHEARGVPQLVAEVAVALAALAVEVDAAAQRGQRGKGEAQRVGAVGRNAVGEFFFGVLAHLRRGLGLAQAFGALVQQRRERDAVDQVHRVEHVAFGLAHLLALRVAHQAVDVDVLERHRPVKCVVIMIIRATQKKMMS